MFDTQVENLNRSDKWLETEDLVQLNKKIEKQQKKGKQTKGLTENLKSQAKIRSFLAGKQGKPFFRRVRMESTF